VECLRPSLTACELALGSRAGHRLIAFIRRLLAKCLARVLLAVATVRLLGRMVRLLAEH